MLCGHRGGLRLNGVRNSQRDKSVIIRHVKQVVGSHPEVVQTSTILVSLRFFSHQVSHIIQQQEDNIDSTCTTLSSLPFGRLGPSSLIVIWRWPNGDGGSSGAGACQWWTEMSRMIMVVPALGGGGEAQGASLG